MANRNLDSLYSAAVKPGQKECSFCPELDSPLALNQRPQLFFAVFPKDAIRGQAIFCLECLDCIFSIAVIIPVSLTDLRIAKVDQILLNLFDWQVVLATVTRPLPGRCTITGNPQLVV